MAKKQDELIEICGLWEGKDKRGGLYMTGPLGWRGKIVVLKNYRRENDKQPSHKLYFTRRGEGEAESPFPEDDLEDVFSP